MERDYSELSMQELIDKLLELRHRLEIIKMAAALRAWADGACIDVDALTDELAEHVDALTEMKAVCEEMLRMVSDKEFDD